MKSLFIAVLGLVLCSSVMAQGKNGNKGGGSLPGCAPSGNTPSKCGTVGGNGGNGGNGGAGGQGGSSSSTSTSTATGGTGIGIGGDASATGGNVKNSGNSSNTNVNVAQGGQGGSAKQGQQQGQIQGQNQSSTSSATNGGQSNMQITNQVRQAPPAIAPEAYPTAPCRVSGSAGVSAPVGGVSFGGSKEDKQCSMRELARMFAAVGQPEAAVQVLCATKAAKEAKPAVCQVK